MGIWQMTENKQLVVGQWDATTDTIWNGATWVPFYGDDRYYSINLGGVNYVIGRSVQVDCQTQEDKPPVLQKWPTWEENLAYLEATKAQLANQIAESYAEEASKTQDPWEALKSMF